MNKLLKHNAKYKKSHTNVIYDMIPFILVGKSIETKNR